MYVDRWDIKQNMEITMYQERETSKKNIIVEFLSRIISYSNANYVTIRYFLIPLIMYVLVQLLLNVELK